MRCASPTAFTWLFHCSRPGMIIWFHFRILIFSPVRLNIFLIYFAEEYAYIDTYHYILFPHDSRRHYAPTVRRAAISMRFWRADTRFRHFCHAMDDDFARFHGPTDMSFSRARRYATSLYEYYGFYRFDIGYIRQAISMLEHFLSILMWREPLAHDISLRHYYFRPIYIFSPIIAWWLLPAIYFSRNSAVSRPPCNAYISYGFMPIALLISFSRFTFIKSSFYATFATWAFYAG